MVGDPKQLSDLAKIEAQVLVTYSNCKARQIWELQDLIADVEANANVRHPWASCHLPYRRIDHRLIELNAPVEEADRL